MKGFIPVTKQALLEMASNCRKEIANQLVSEKAEQIDRFVSREKERMTSRRWYRLFTLPKARFDFDEESVMAYAASIDYPMFEGNPFTTLEKDAENSLNWIARLERIAESQYSGEPIQIDIKTFTRISEPHRYYWVQVGFYYTVR
jgi:hypothetical protein